MAKKKMNLKAGARKVASRAKQAAGKLDVMSIVKANAGGFGAAFAVDKLDDMEAVQGMGEFAAPLMVEAGAIVLAMSGNKALEPVAYGAMGGAAALMYAPAMEKMQGDEPTNGTNTIDATRRARRLLANVVRKAAQQPLVAKALQQPLVTKAVRKAQPILDAVPMPGTFGGRGMKNWRQFSSMRED